MPGRCGGLWGELTWASFRPSHSACRGQPAPHTACLGGPEGSESKTKSHKDGLVLLGWPSPCSPCRLTGVTAPKLRKTWHSLPLHSPLQLALTKAGEGSGPGQPDFGQCRKMEFLPCPSTHAPTSPAMLQQCHSLVPQSPLCVEDSSFPLWPNHRPPSWFLHRSPLPPDFRSGGSCFCPDSLFHGWSCFLPGLLILPSLPSYSTCFFSGI